MNRHGALSRALTLVAVLAVTASAMTAPVVAVVSVPTDGSTTVTADIPGDVPASSDQYAVRQGGSCRVIEPLGDGSQSVEEFYNYQINSSRALYSSIGTIDLQENQTSQFFVYEGANGTSLVLLHDAVNGSDGGTAEMTFTGLPENGSWPVEDDTYYERDDEFDHNGSTSNIVWVWSDDRNDGGAFLGLDRSFERITIDPAFNEESSAYPFEGWSGAPEDNHITEWMYRTGSGENVTLNMNQNVTIEPGTCEQNPPSASLSASGADVTTDDTVTFDASGSSDAEGIVEYQWDFDGDGTVETTTEDPTVEHRYTEGGEFDATVTVIDEGRNDDAASVPISVEVVATEVTGCRVIDEPGTYNLTQDITNDSADTCLRVDSDNVTINGNGHTVSGSGANGIHFNGTGGWNNQLTDVTLRDITVTGWSVNVRTMRSWGVRYEGVTVSEGGYGTYIANSRNVTIVDSTALDNLRGEGPSSHLGLGFSFRNTRDVLIRNANAVGNRWGYHLEANTTNVSIADSNASENTAWDYYQNPRETDGAYLSHDVDNFTMGNVTASFEVERAVALRGAESTPSPPDGLANAGGYVTYGRAGSNPVLNSLTISYDDSAPVNESTLSMWEYAWSTEDGQSSGEWQEMGDAAVDADANTVSVDDVSLPGISGAENRIVFAPLGDATDEAPTGTPPTAAIDAPDTVAANESASFSAADSTDDGSIESYEWAFGDGGTATGESVEHVYDEPGDYTVELTVTDDEGNTNSTTATVSVAPADTPPNATFALSETVSAGSSVTLDAGESDDENGIAEYRWDFDGDGAIDAVTAEPTVDHEFTTVGNVTVTLTVVDGNGTAASTSRTVTVADGEAPTAAIGVAGNLTANATTAFTAAGSEDNVGVESYEWAFGDGATATGAVVRHSYGASGDYTVELTVTDAAGNADTVTRTVTVDPADENATPPTAALDAPATAAVDESVTLDASGSDDDDGIAEYRWDFDGDGTVDATTTEPTVEHAFAETGNATVIVTAADANGSTASAFATVDVVNDRAPIAVIDATPNATAGEEVSFSAANSSDDGSIESYEWAFGDGETATGEEVTHTYDAGNYTVTLTVTDDNGTTDTATYNVTVAESNDGGNGGGGGGGGGGDDDDDDDGGAGDDDDGDGGAGGSDGGDGGAGGSDGGDDDDDETETPTATPTPAPADISVTGLEANRTNVASGQPIELVATVENAGDEAGTYTVELELFGEVVDQRQVEVPGGETVSVSFTQTIDAAGSYTARVGDQTVSLTVDQGAGAGQTATADVTSTTTPGFGPVTVLLAALVAFAGVALGVRREGDDR